MANAFTLDCTSETTAKESPRLAIALCGALRAADWPDAERDADYPDLRGIIEHFSAAFHLGPIACQRADEDASYLAPRVSITAGRECIGFMGRLKPSLASAYHAKKPIWTAELDLTVIRRIHEASKIAFTPLAVFPASTRDITVIAPETLSAESIRECLEKANIRFLEQISLIKLFEPKDSQSRNLTFRLVFRHPERTLKDNEVDKEREKAAELLTEKLGVRI